MVGYVPFLHLVVYDFMLARYNEMRKVSNLRSGEDQVTGEESGSLTKEADGLLDREDHIGSRALLDDLSVEDGLDVQSLWIGDDLSLLSILPRTRIHA